MAKTTTLAAIEKLMLKDLKRSGLTKRDLHVTPSLTDLRGQPKPGYRISYPQTRDGRSDCLRSFSLSHETFGMG